MSGRRVTSSSEETDYVDIYGRDVKVLVCNNTGTILVPLDELKSMGVTIYKKSNYHKLLVDESQFNSEFHNFMLSCAESYMLDKTTVFKETQVVESIEKCKKLLSQSSDAKKTVSIASPPKFFNNHLVTTTNDNGINVTTKNFHGAPLTREPNQTLREPTQNPLFHDGVPKLVRTPSSTSLKSSLKPVDMNQLVRSPSSTSLKSYPKTVDLNQAEPPQRRSFENRSDKGAGPYGQQRPGQSNFEAKENKRPYEPRKFQAENKYNGFDQRQRDFDEQRPRGFDQNRFVRSPPKHDGAADDNSSQGDENKGVPRVQLNKPEHQVMITHKEKPNVVWVQDVENADTLLDINEKIKEEAPNAGSVTRADYNKFYLAPFEKDWYRCKPLKFKPLTLLFVDFGNTAELSVSELREASNALQSIPAQAVRVAFDNNVKLDALPTVFTIKIRKQFDKGTYLADLVNDRAPSVEPEVPQARPKTPTPEKSPTGAIKITLKTYFNKPKPLCTLQNGERVMIANKVDNKLVLRTKECYDKLKQIEQALQTTKVETVKAKLEQGQMVLCEKDDKLYRGQVVKMLGNLVEVELIDYCDKIQIAAASIMHMTESLSLEPLTCIVAPPLKGLEWFNEGQRAFVKELIEKKTKAVVVMKDSGEFDLNTANGSLAEQLKSLKTSDKTMLSSLAYYKLPLGPGSYMLYGLSDNADVHLVSNDALEQYVENIIKDDVDDDEPYTPVVGEVCLAPYEGSWSRCAVSKILGPEFEVKFIDFGNSVLLKAEQLRKLGSDDVAAPILGVPCRFVGFPPKADDVLQNIVADGKEFQVVVKKYNAAIERYEIECPTIYKDMENM